MTDQHAPEIDPADAFEGVRSQLSLLHSAVERLITHVMGAFTLDVLWPRCK